MERPPARLFAALSQDPKRNIVLRRGPSRHVALFLWDRTKDEFTLGQWFKGRIYEHRLDISPDGRHWIYFALGRGGGTWTVVAETPLFTALDFYPWSGAWFGGGVFLSDNSYGLMGAGALRGDRRTSGLKVAELKEEAAGLQWASSVYGRRLHRDGWTLSSQADETGDHMTRFKKPIIKNFSLQKCVVNANRENRSLENEFHEILGEDGAAIASFPDWEWAEVDGQTLLWAEAGCLYRGKVNRDGAVVEKRILHDFNDYKFEEIAPPWDPLRA